MIQYLELDREVIKLGGATMLLLLALGKVRKDKISHDSGEWKLLVANTQYVSGPAGSMKR